MTEETSIYSSDLAGVVVGETAISDVQGENGLLSYRGIDINDLIGTPFLHVVWLVLFGEWAGRTAETTPGVFHVPPRKADPQRNRPC